MLKLQFAEAKHVVKLFVRVLLLFVVFFEIIKSIDPKAGLTESTKAGQIEGRAQRNLSFEESTHNKKQRSRPRPKKEPEKPIKLYSQSEVDHLLEVEREICQRKINEIMKQYQDTVQELVIPMNKNISYIS